MRVAGFACAWRAWDVHGTPASTAPATPPTKVRRSMLFSFILTPLCAPRPNVSCFPSVGLTPPYSQTLPHPSRSAAAPPPPRAPPAPPAETPPARRACPRSLPPPPRHGG